MKKITELTDAIIDSLIKKEFTREEISEALDRAKIAVLYRLFHTNH